MRSAIRVQSLDTLKKRLNASHTTGKTWREIAGDYPGVPPGTLCAIAKGREPKSNQVREALGLPVYVQVETCSKCGQGHRYPTRCAAKRKRHSDKKLVDMPVSVLAWKIRNRA